MSDPEQKPLDPYDPEVIARSNRAILVGLQRPGETAAEAQCLLDELHELVGNVGVEIRGSLIAKIREENPRTLVGSGKLEEIAALARAKECCSFLHVLTMQQTEAFSTFCKQLHADFFMPLSPSTYTK